MAMVMCMNQQINPTLLLDQQVIKAKIPLFNKALFKNGIEESSFIGREVMKVSLKTIYMADVTRVMRMLFVKIMLRFYLLNYG